MKLEQTDSLGNDPERFLEFRGETYDLTDNPIVFFTLEMVFFGIIWGLVVTGAYALYLVWDAVSLVTGGVPSFVWDGLMATILIWFALGLIKLYFTGSAKPFFKVTFSVRDETEENEA